MSHLNLRSFLRALLEKKDLVRIKAPVDPNQEITIIQHRVMAQNGPALLFENVKGSPYRLASNLFGTKERVNMAFGCEPAEIGERILSLAHDMMPPKFSRLWSHKQTIFNVLQSRFQKVKTGPVLERTISVPDLNQLPVLTCWPEDGGPFFTLPLVHTVGPADQKGNLGIYRLQRFDAASTGMHWQIEKGGGFHFKQAAALKQPLPISVFLGGPPILTIAAVAPLPEGIDERLLAAFILKRPLKVIFRKQTGHLIPAEAEFVLEGSVTPGDMRREGPFGDHFGHYSHSADFPVYRVNRILARKDAIYPATVVGKPVQEDFYIGIALQDMAGPLLNLVKPAVCDIWAYPETGFHPLAVMSVKERYPREALKHTLGMLGEGQVSLTKIMITVDCNVNVRDFDQVSKALWQCLDAHDGMHLLAPTAQDTLDFTGPAMNSGSRLLLIATRKDGKPLRDMPVQEKIPTDIHADICQTTTIGPSFLICTVKENASIDDIFETLLHNEATRTYLFYVILSDDIDISDRTQVLWSWFTRFDPLLDIRPAKKVVQGNRLLFDFPIMIDARWKNGYPKPVAFDPDVEKRVDQRWHELGLGKGF